MSTSTPSLPFGETDAVELFTDRARAVEPSFAQNDATAELCRRLDCLPLAIELAAARMKALDPTDLIHRFEPPQLPLLAGGPADAPVRQQTMRATIEWSHDLLSEHQQELFAGLALFAGGFTLEAAEEVCNADLDALETLVEQSLVYREGGRFHMLETIHAYARERLEQSPHDDELRRRHANFYLDRAERLHLHDLERRPPPAVRRALFEPERANSFAALEYFRRMGDRTNEARLAATVLSLDFWSSPKEGRRWLGEAVTYRDVPPITRAAVVWAASRIARNEGDLALDIELNEEQLELWRLMDAKQPVVRTLVRLAITSTARGDHARARTALEEANAIAVELGTDLAHAFVALAEAVVALYSEQLDDAQMAAERAIERFRRAEATPGITSALSCAGTVAVLQERYEDAARSFRESLVARNEAGAFWQADADLEGLARVAMSRGATQVAAVLLGAANASRAATGAGQDPFMARLCEHTHEAVRFTLGLEQFNAAFAEGHAMTTESAVEYALANVA